MRRESGALQSKNIVFENYAEWNGDEAAAAAAAATNTQITFLIGAYSMIYIL